MKDTEDSKGDTAAIVFDADGTWYRWQLFAAWIAEAVHLGILPQIVLERAQPALDAYRNRTGDFDAFVSKQVKAYQDDGRLAGMRTEDATFAAEEMIRKRGRWVHVFPHELAAAGTEIGLRLAIISGSPREVVAVFAKANGISIFLGTEHPTEAGRFTGGRQKEWCMEKGNALRHLAQEHRLTLSASVAIGDTTTDSEMFRIVKYPICFNPNSGLESLARSEGWPIVVERKDCIFIFKPDSSGRLCEATCSEILPAPLAERLVERLLIARRRHEYTP